MPYHHTSTWSSASSRPKRHIACRWPSGIPTTNDKVACCYITSSLPEISCKHTEHILMASSSSHRCQAAILSHNLADVPSTGKWVAIGTLEHRTRSNAAKEPCDNLKRLLLPCTMWDCIKIALRSSRVYNFYTAR